MSKSEDQPHGTQLCGAQNRQEKPCSAPAMKNGRCRFHGGLSTGPKTLEGKARSRRANWKHGMYSAEAIEERSRIREFLKHVKISLREVV